MVNSRIDKDTKFMFSGNKAVHVSKGRSCNTIKVIDIENMKIVNSLEIKDESRMGFE